MADTYNLSLTADVIDDILVWLDDNYETIIKQSDLLSGTGSSTIGTMTQAAITAALAAKQDTLTFDNTPTQSSTKPVTSGGIYAAIETTAEQVNQLEQRVDSNYTKITGDIVTEPWEIGSINTPANGHIPDYSSTTRIRLPEMVCQADGEYTITCNTGFEFLVYVVGKITTVDWLGNRTIPLVAGDIYRIAIRQSPQVDYEGYTQSQIDAVAAAAGLKMSGPGIIPELGQEATKSTERLDTIFSTAQEYAPAVLQTTPITYSGDVPTIVIDGNTLLYTSNVITSTKYIGFKVSDIVPRGIATLWKIIFYGNQHISEMSICRFTTSSSKGFILIDTDPVDGVCTLNYTIPQDNNEYFLVLAFDRGDDVFNNEPIVYEISQGDNITLKSGIINENNLNPNVSQKLITNIEGNTNVFVGKDAGANTQEPTGSDEGHYNTGVGVNAMKDNTTGDHCTAIGFQAMQKNTTGDGNTACGEDALYENTDGTSNTAVGAHTLQNSKGSQNTAVGTSAGMNVTTGFFNTIIGGYNAGSNLTTGARNVLLGAGADVGNGGRNDSIVVGMTTSDKDGQIIIGSSRSMEFVLHLGNQKIKLVFNQDNTVTWETVI